MWLNGRGVINCIGYCCKCENSCNKYQIILICLLTFRLLSPHEGKRNDLRGEAKSSMKRRMTSSGEEEGRGGDGEEGRRGGREEGR